MVAALVFLASAALTATWCASMSSMPGMRMPGGWTMSMAWMRMPGQDWPGAAAAFLGMWLVMMIAMMLPVLAPGLWRFRRTLHANSASRLAGLVWISAAAYFFAWMLPGALAYLLGARLAAAEMQSPALSHAVPLAAGVAIAFAGTLQLSRWKLRQLACCRETADCCQSRPGTALAALRHGLTTGARCVACCAPFTLVLLVVGVMDLAAMAAVTVAISAERLLPRGARVAQALGILLVGAGCWRIAQAVAG